MIFETVQRVIMEQMLVTDKSLVCMETNLKTQEFGTPPKKVDSLDMASIIMNLEDEYNVEIPQNDETSKYETVGQFVALLELLTKNKKKK
jgi:acyl carrier protein